MLGHLVFFALSLFCNCFQKDVGCRVNNPKPLLELFDIITRDIEKLPKNMNEVGAAKADEIGKMFALARQFIKGDLEKYANLLIKQDFVGCYKMLDEQVNDCHDERRFVEMFQKDVDICLNSSKNNLQDPFIYVERRKDIFEDSSSSASEIAKLLVKRKKDPLVVKKCVKVYNKQGECHVIELFVARNSILCNMGELCIPDCLLFTHKLMEITEEQEIAIILALMLLYKQQLMVKHVNVERMNVLYKYLELAYDKASIEAVCAIKLVIVKLFADLVVDNCTTRAIDVCIKIVVAALNEKAERKIPFDPLKAVVISLFGPHC